MKKLLLFLLLFFPLGLFGTGNTRTIPFNGAPTGTCAFMMLANDLTNGNEYFCDQTSHWKLLVGSTLPLPSSLGGTGNAFTKFAGPTTTEKTFTLPDASATILTTNSPVNSTQVDSSIVTNVATSATGAYCDPLDVSCLVLNEEFQTNGTGSTTNQGSVQFTYPWAFLFNCGTAGGQGLTPGSTTTDFWIATLTNCTTFTANDQVAMKLHPASSTSNFTQAFAATANWSTLLRFFMAPATNIAVRLGFCSSANAANTSCQGATTSSVAIRYDTSQSDAGFLGEACDGAACTVTASTLCSASNTWFTFKMWSSAAGTINFSCNGGATQSVTTHIPTASLNPYLWEKSLTGNAGSVHVSLDYFKFKIWALAGR